jgi:hypothetical protein
LSGRGVEEKIRWAVFIYGSDYHGRMTDVKANYIQVFKALITFNLHFTRYYYGDQIKGDEMGGHVARV